MTNRGNSRAIAAEISERAERRRVRRGRQPSAQQGQGHGKRTYVQARANTAPTFAERQQQRQARQEAKDALAKLRRIFRLVRS